MTLHAATVARRLGAIVVLLVVASTAVHVITAITGHDTFYGLAALFELDNENNIPTWYSSVLLLLSAVLLALTAHAQPAASPWTRYWWGLSLIFLLLSVDEAASLHEKFNRPVRELLDMGASVHFAWVVPASLMLLVLVMGYARWLFSLPPRSRNLALISASLYVGGAVGFELVGGLLTDRIAGGFGYLLVSTVEETLEMCGAVVWIYTLIDLAAARGADLHVRFAP